MTSKRTIHLHHLLFILVISLGAATSSPAQTALYGTIPGGVWTKDGSPYIVNGTVYVESNLRIEPGVTVKFNYRDGYVSQLHSNNGYIKAIGTDTDSILFTQINPEEPVTALSNWFTFMHKDSLHRTNVFKYCIFEKGVRGYYGLPSNADVSDTIMHSTFRNLTTGIGQSGRGGPSNVYISDCQFYDTKQAVLAVDDSFCRLEMERCLVYKCWSGIFRSAPGSLSVRSSVFRNLDFEAIRLFNPGGPDVGTLVVDIGGEPTYCNKMHNNNRTLNDGNKNIKVEPGVIVNASYNYWGDIHPDSVRASIEDPAGEVVYLPYTDENCEVVPLGLNPRETPSSIALSVYPNPTVSGLPVTISFSLENSSEVDLRLQDMLGRTVHKESLSRRTPGKYSHRLSTANLKPGTYYYTLTISGRMQTRSLVVVK